MLYPPPSVSLPVIILLWMCNEKGGVVLPTVIAAFGLQSWWLHAFVCVFVSVRLQDKHLILQSLFPNLCQSISLRCSLIIKKKYLPSSIFLKLYNSTYQSIFHNYFLSLPPPISAIHLEEKFSVLTVLRPTPLLSFSLSGSPIHFQRFFSATRVSFLSPSFPPILNGVKLYLFFCCWLSLCPPPLSAPSPLQAAPPDLHLLGQNLSYPHYLNFSTSPMSLSLPASDPSLSYFCHSIVSAH